MSTHYSFIPCLLYRPTFLHRLLGKFFAVLEKHISKHVLDRYLNRKSRLGNLEKYDRLINDFNTDFVACFLPFFDFPGSFQL